MRKPLMWFCLIVLTVLVSAAVFGAMAGEAPESVTIDDCAAKKAAVEFPHKAHFEVTECTTCHHTSEGLTADSDIEVETCASCHLEPAEETTPKCSEMSTKKNPFHLNCITCHKETLANNPESPAPTKCDGCHPKAEG